MTKSDDEKLIPLNSLKAKFGRAPTSSLKKPAERHGVKLQRSGRKGPLLISQKDANYLFQKMQAEKQYRITPDHKDEQTGISGVYAVEVPSYDGPTRIKIGWSDKIDDRLSTYRTVIPDLRVKRRWPCNERWLEQAALKVAKRVGKQIGEELFEFPDNEAALNELDDILSKMGIQPR